MVLVLTPPSGPTSKAELMEPFEVPAFKLAAKDEGAANVIDPLLVETRISVQGILFQGETAVPHSKCPAARVDFVNFQLACASMMALDVSASNRPCTPVAVILPLEVLRMALPLESLSSMLPLEVVASTSPVSLTACTAPFEVATRVRPSTSSIGTLPLEVSAKRIYTPAKRKFRGGFVRD